MWSFGNGHHCTFIAFYAYDTIDTQSAFFGAILFHFTAMDSFLPLYPIHRLIRISDQFVYITAVIRV